MRRLTAARRAARPLAALALAVAAAAPAQAAWTGTQRLVMPAGDPAERLGPAWADRGGAATALLLDDGPAGSRSGWTALTRAPLAEWSAAAAAAPPDGLRPVAATPRGVVLAAGLVPTAAGPVLAAALRRDGAWGDTTPVSGPLPGGGAGVVPAAVLGPEGHAALAWVEGGVARAALVDGDRVVALAGPGPGVPVVRVNESGDAVAAWTRRAGASEILVSAMRPAGAPRWTRPVPVPAPRRLPPGALSVDLDVGASGFAILAWAAGRAGANRVWWTYATRPGGEWSTAAAVTPPVGGARVRALRMTAAGDAVLVWSTVTGLFSATRPSGAPSWSPDGRVVGAPGRGRAAVAPVEVVANRTGDLVAAWPLRDGVAVSARTFVPGPWAAADVLPAAPGPLVARVALGEAGDVVATWAVRSGVGSGRVGAAVRPAADAPLLTSAVATVSPDGLALDVGLTAPGRVHVEVRPVGGPRPAGVFIAALPGGVTRVTPPRVVADVLAGGRRYLVRVRTDGRDAASSDASSVVTMPR